MESIKNLKREKFTLDEDNKHHVFTVEFDGETYRSVVPAPMAEEFGLSHYDEADAWGHIVVARHNNPPAQQWGIDDPKRCARSLWESLGDVLTDDADVIEQDWLVFEKGTYREEIWHWFEETFDVSVAIDLMKVEAGFDRVITNKDINHDTEN